MGTDNADLIRALEDARNRGDEAEYDRLSPLVRQSQEECTHPRFPHAERMCDKTSKHGRYKRGDILVYCRACSKILAVNGRPNDPLEDEAWLKLHPDTMDPR